MSVMEISNNYNKYADSYTNNITSEHAESCAKEGVEVNKYDEQKFLSELNNKHPQLNIMSGKVNKNYRSGQYPNKVDVMIASNILAKMAQDPEADNKYGKMLADIPGCEKWANSMIKSMTGNEVKYRQVWIDENGNMGSFSISGPSEKHERIDKERKEKTQEDFEERLRKKREKSKELEEWLQGKRETLPNSDLLELTQNMWIDIRV